MISAEDICEDCRLVGDDYYYDDDGNLCDACIDCPFNENNYDEDGYRRDDI